MKALALAMALAAIPTLAGCSSTSASCSGGTACGGDMIGQWRVTSSCLTESYRVDLGTGRGFTLEADLSVSGTLSVSMDGTYTMSTSVSGTLKGDVPAADLQEKLFTLTCDQVAQAIEAARPALGASCGSDGAGGCNCTANLTTTESTDYGNYQSRNMIFTMASQTHQATIPWGYCVSGNQLTLISADPAHVENGSIVLFKQ